MLPKVLLLAVLVHGAWSIEHGAWGRPRPFAWYMLHARQADVPENSQERNKIWMKEPERVKENEKKLANLGGVQTRPENTNWIGIL